MLRKWIFYGRSGQSISGRPGLVFRRGRSARRRKLRAEFLNVAFRPPSLVAEVSPLMLWWNDHLPVLADVGDDVWCMGVNLVADVVLRGSWGLNLRPPARQRRFGLNGSCADPLHG